MVDIVNWLDIAKKYHKGSLLLGNGASIAINSCFNYKSLFELAEVNGFITPEVKDVFNRFNVDDFELVLRRLWQAKEVNSALNIPVSQVDNAYKCVQDALIKAVRKSHILYDDALPHLSHIYEFMSKFSYVISLNYDLIVYWAAQLGNRSLGRWFKDGFTHGGIEFDDDWERLLDPYGAKGATLYFYPHGNLVLYRVNFSGERKVNVDIHSNLLDAIVNKWTTNSVAPLFVSEGTEDLKRSTISSSNYLEKVFYEVLPSLPDTLVVYGWGFGDQDQHIIDQIKKSAVKNIAVSIYGNNQILMGDIANKLKALNLTDLVFFDSQSAGCWNNP